MKKTNKSDLEEALKLCKGAFISAAGFSMVINLLQLVPTIYMLQLYDRVVPTGNQSTLLMLTLIMLVLFLTMGVSGVGALTDIGQSQFTPGNIT